MLLGDTNEDAIGWLIQDETIGAMLSQFPFSEAVAQLAMGLAVRFAQEPDWYDDEGGVRARWNSRVKAWQTLATSLRTGEGKTEMGATGVVYGVQTLGVPQHCRMSDAHDITTRQGGMRF